MLPQFIVSLLMAYVYIIIKSKKSYHMLQQNWYNDGNRYINWILDNKRKVFITPELLFVLFLLFFILPIKVSMSIFIIFYMMMSLIYIKAKKTEQVKKPLVFTSRVKRLCVTTMVLYLIPVILFIIFFNIDYIYLYYLLFGLMIYLNYFVVYIANIVNMPIEASIRLKFKRMAIKKLNSMNHMKVIGITGSYGKTSSKNILSDILNVKYNALPTPKNFNTPLGIIRTINNDLDKFNDLFIAEMGAFKRGEIQELCDLVHPTYGILTKIGTAHMDSFGSQENIQKGKFELIESLPSDGIGILNKDDELQVSYKLKNNVRIIWIGIKNEDADVRACDIKLSHTGTKFNVVFKGDKRKYPFETKLLGEANVYNILAGVALGHALGISINQLQVGVKKVCPVEHRLELKKYLDINIIDDAYNSNPVGSSMALDVLALMPGKKIIVTPGMIEMGDIQDDLNKEFGKHIASVCDEVILVGETQTKPIYDGLISKKYPKKKIHVINDVKLAFPMMQQLKDKKTYVLLENDLPDIFNEK